VAKEGAYIAKGRRKRSPWTMDWKKGPRQREKKEKIRS
jgi:hypothetical protein